MKGAYFTSSYECWIVGSIVRKTPICTYIEIVYVLRLCGKNTCCSKNSEYHHCCPYTDCLKFEANAPTYIAITYEGRDIREKLHSKKKTDVVFGTCITSPSPHFAVATRAIPGLDFVFIDTEHIPIGRETLAWMCRTYRS